MLEDSFDVKANRFGLLLCKGPLYNIGIKNYIGNLCTNGSTQDGLDRIISTALREGGIIVDFDEIDGLLMKDLKELDTVNDEFITFIIYDKFAGFNASGDERWQLRIKDTLVLLYGDGDLDTPVDDMIANLYYKNYEEMSEERKRGARCFLQRYKFGTKEKTLNKLIEAYKTN